ncbi:DUF6493 family protein [Streptomyces sp. NPDC057301]|uniref:DUF7824 domain-containing protein n=1 Tax=Streptomyces sp. NPDC057301 TaxID=3346093 RepID=UPI0036441C96
MNDFNTWLAQFADEDSAAGEFVRQVSAMPDWPDGPDTSHRDYVRFTFRPPWGSELRTSTEPLQSLWTRYISERVGPVAVPSELLGAARTLAVALERGSSDEVRKLCRETRLEPDQRDLLLSRALQVHRVWESHTLGRHETDKDRLGRIARMRMFAMAWHPDPGQAVGFVQYSGLDDDAVVDMVEFRDPSWLAGFGHAAGLSSGLVKQFCHRLEHLAPTEAEFSPLLEIWAGASTHVPGMNKKLLSRTVTALARLDRLPAGQVKRWTRALHEEHTAVAANAVTALTTLAGEPSHLTGEQVADVLRVVTDGPSGKATVAVACVAAFWDAGLLSDQQVTEWAGHVLFRPERTVANAVVRLLGQALRADPSRADALLPALAGAFAHPAADTQEKALALIAEHHERLGEEARARVARATGQLPAPVRRQAIALLELPGEEPDRPEEHSEVALPHVDLLPEPAPAGPVEPPLRDAQEVAVELGAVLSARIPQPLAVERVLDGLVRLALSDRPALAEALQPVLRPYENRQRDEGHLREVVLVEVFLLALAVAGRAAPDLHIGSDRDQWHKECGHRVFDSVITARLVEVAQRIEAGEALPFLLATPTLSTGEIEPRVLLERLHEYRRRGVRVGAADFDQALFRLRPDPGIPHTPAEELGTPEGHRLARWMADGLFPAPPSEQAVILPFTYPDDPGAASGYPTGWNLKALERAAEEYVTELRRQGTVGPPPPWAPPGAGPGTWWEFEPGLIRIGAAGVMGRLDGFSPAFRAVGEAYRARQNHCAWAFELQAWRRTFPLWLAVVPGHPDVVVTRTLTSFAEGAERDRSSAAVHLPAVAEAAGPAGPAVHLALAYGMGAAKMAERTAAADALLCLSGRSELDTGRLGGMLAELINIDALKPKRVAQTLRSAASVAPAGVHAVLAAALPLVLPQDAGPARAGLAELLALAVDCAEAAPGRPPITGVPAIAARGGTSLLVRTARRLLNM